MPKGQVTPLTPRQEKFCQSILAGTNQSDAYREHYSTKNMKPESVHRLAHKLIENVKIASRIKELRKPAIEKLLVTHEDHIRTLRSLRDGAKKKGQYAAAIKAEENCGKVSGLYVQEIKHTGELKVTGVLKVGGGDMSMEDWLKATGGTATTEE